MNYEDYILGSDCCYARMSAADIKIGLCPVCCEFCEIILLEPEPDNIEEMQEYENYLRSRISNPNQLKLFQNGM